MPQIDPLFAWLGRKDWLASAEHAPIYLDALRSARTYREPFFGSGGFFFGAVCALDRPPRAVLSDRNLHMVHAYKVVAALAPELAEKLADLRYSEHCFEHSKRLLNEVRRTGLRLASDVDRAAAFFAVCQWGFNGLYRENQAGEINHPLGRPPKPFPTLEQLRAAASVLAPDRVELRCEDFEASCARAAPGDFVYLDPPYDGTFVSYTSRGFSGSSGPGSGEQSALFDLRDMLPTASDLGRLQSAVEHLHARGARFLLSQADTPVVRAMFERFQILEVQVRRSVAAKAKARGTATELLILNFGPGFET